MRFDDKVLIDAPIDVVWGLTERVAHWPEITPTMQRVDVLDDGDLAVGTRARVKQPGRGPAVWTVTRLESPTVFEWETTVFGVRMTAAHHLSEVDGGCENALSIELSGLGSGLVGRLAGAKIRDAIRTENAAFKKQAEAYVR